MLHVLFEEGTVCYQFPVISCLLVICIFIVSPSRPPGKIMLDLSRDHQRCAVVEN